MGRDLWVGDPLPNPSSSSATAPSTTTSAPFPICVAVAAGKGGIALAGAHQNLAITGNRIENCRMPGIVVCSTRGWMREAGLTKLKPVVEINCK